VEILVEILKEADAGLPANEVWRKHRSIRLPAMSMAPRWQEGSGPWSDDDRFQTTIRSDPADGARKWDIRSYSPGQMAGLEGHC